MNKKIKGVIKLFSNTKCVAKHNAFLVVSNEFNLFFKKKISIIVKDGSSYCFEFYKINI